MDVVLDCVVGVPVYDPVDFHSPANDNVRPAQGTRYAEPSGEHRRRNLPDATRIQ